MAFSDGNLANLIAQNQLNQLSYEQTYMQFV